MERLDVARCPHCIKHHDKGHGVFDEIAVERAMTGDPVRLTRDEQVEALRRLASQGLSDAVIAARLHVTSKTIGRLRAEYEIESRWTA